MMIFRRRKDVPKTDEQRDCEAVKDCDLFDGGWYLRRYPDVAEAGFDPALHYVRHGAAEGRWPGPWFDPARYLAATSEKEIGNPLLHHLKNKDVFNGAPAVAPRKYENFEEYLSYSLLQPVVRAPFKEEDRRCFGVMDSLTEHLFTRLRNQDQLISVVMPVWNRSATLPAAIESVLNQSYRNLELIVVDDGSEDESVSIAETFARLDTRVRPIILQTHIGVSAARNVALEQISGDFVAYLDSDNSWLPHFLAASVALFQLENDIDAVYSGQYLYEPGNRAEPAGVRFGPVNKSLLEQHNYIDLNCLIHRRAVLQAKIRFDESLARLVDWDFILQITKRFRLCGLPILQCNYFNGLAENAITKTVPLSPAQDYIIEKWKRPPDGGHTRLSRPVCVVIPSFNALEYLRLCIASLSDAIQDELLEVIIVDNNSSHDVREFLDGLSDLKIKIILNEENYGFSYAVNQGVKVASPMADVVILNNDAELSPNAITWMQQVAYQSSDIAITVPRQMVPPGATGMNTHVPYADPTFECDVTLSSHHKNVAFIDIFHNGELVELNFAPFFCAYIKREVWNACGGLDYVRGRHYRSDRIMCDMVRHVLKKRIVYTPNAIVAHAQQVATRELANKIGLNDEFQKMLVENRWPADMRQRLGIVESPWMV
jgi:glycosyltransferase involved in cell wall biosynthesis